MPSAQHKWLNSFSQLSTCFWNVLNWIKQRGMGGGGENPLIVQLPSSAGRTYFREELVTVKHFSVSLKSKPLLFNFLSISLVYFLYLLLLIWSNTNTNSCRIKINNPWFQQCYSHFSFHNYFYKTAKTFSELKWQWQNYFVVLCMNAWHFPPNQQIFKVNNQ